MVHAVPVTCDLGGEPQGSYHRRRRSRDQRETASGAAQERFGTALHDLGGPPERTES